MTSSITGFAAKLMVFRAGWSPTAASSPSLSDSGSMLRCKGDRWQPPLDLATAGLQPGRGGEADPQLGRRLVEGEAGRVGGDLEEDAPGLPEADRVEVPAVVDVRDVESGLHELPAPDPLLVVARRPPGHVMDRPGGDHPWRFVGASGHDVDD